MKKLILLFAMALVMQSCYVTIEIPPCMNGNLTPEQTNNICWLSDTTSLIGLDNDDCIYAINSNQMKDLLIAKDRTIVYRWLPYDMKNNIPIYFVQSYCDENNIELYVITNEYTAAFAEIDNVKNPIFSMNIGDCMINVDNKLEDKFYKELFGNKYKKKFHIYYLENGELVRTEDEMMNEKWKKKWE